MESLILILFASFFNAVAERINGRHFIKSVFSKLTPCFWDRRVSAECTRKVCGYPFDAYFVCNLSMIVSVCIAIIVYSPITHAPVIDFLVYVGVWTMNYETFFSLILRRKKRII